MTKEIRQKLAQERKVSISCIVPVHNESENIVQFITELRAKLKQHTDQSEIIIIDDGSRDNTVNLIETSLLGDDLKLLVFSRNFGKEKALSAGLDHCHSDVAILIDADFQHPLDTIDDFICEWQNGADMVYGVRDSRRGENFIKRSFTKLFYWFMSNLGEIKLPANAGDFRLLDRKVIEALKSCPERSRFMKGLYAWVGFKTTEVIYPIKKRAAGTSSWHFMRLADLALTGIISFSDLPLRVWSLIGLFISFISLLSAVYIIVDTLIFGADLPGYATLLTVIVFFGGLQMLSIGILGEYLSRIFREVKQRPQYIISKKIGLDD